MVEGQVAGVRCQVSFWSWQFCILKPNNNSAHNTIAKRNQGYFGKPYFLTICKVFHCIFSWPKSGLRHKITILFYLKWSMAATRHLDNLFFNTKTDWKRIPIYKWRNWDRRMFFWSWLGSHLRKLTLFCFHCTKNDVLNNFLPIWVNWKFCGYHLCRRVFVCWDGNTC